MAQEAPALFDLPDEELERRRHTLSYAVIWGNVETSPELAEIEREIDRRVRARDAERRSEVTQARQEAWRRFEEREAALQAADQSQQSAEEATAHAEARRRAEEERLQAKEAERLKAEDEERVRAEEERKRREEEERRKAEQERRRREAELRKLAKEQLKTAKLLDFGTGRIVELAASFVEREDAMYELAAALGEPAGDDDDQDVSEQDLDRFDQAQTVLGAILRSRLSAIPELRMQPATGTHSNGEKKNGNRPTLEGQTKALLGDLLSPPRANDAD
jgi:predicted ATP-dependent protease